MGRRVARDAAVLENRAMQPEPGLDGEREQQDEVLLLRGIGEGRALQAVARVPRHGFVDPAEVRQAYADEPLPIGLGQTISQPYTVAYQTEWLDVAPGDRVLEVGTGSGYQAAVLVEMGLDVYSVERHAPLQAQALRILGELGYRLSLKLGDGSLGWPERSPFDAILVTAGAEVVPPELLRQLREPADGRRGGRLVIPVGGTDGQVMMRYTRTGREDFEEERGDLFRFVPLVAEEVRL